MTLFAVGHAMINVIDGLLGALFRVGHALDNVSCIPVSQRMPMIYRMGLTSVGLAMVNVIYSIGAIL